MILLPQTWKHYVCHSRRFSFKTTWLCTIRITIIWIWFLLHDQGININCACAIAIQPRNRHKTMHQFGQRKSTSWKLMTRRSTHSTPQETIVDEQQFCTDVVVEPGISCPIDKIMPSKSPFTGMESIKESNRFVKQIDSRRGFLVVTLLGSSGVWLVESSSSSAQIDVVSFSSDSKPSLTDNTIHQQELQPLSSSSSSSSSSSTRSFPSVVTATTMTSDAAAAVDWTSIFQKASKKALGGGKAGAAAAVVQVCSLMWLRTSMNYQYRYGGNLQSSLRTLWNEGGIQRLYQGLPFALIQGPLTRFGDTAANIGILALLETIPLGQEMPLPLKTFFGSFAAGLWRIILMPIDASKTAMQVEGQSALTELWTSVFQYGPGVLYRGSIAQAAATMVGHFPWFLTYNYLDSQLPIITPKDDLFLSLCRSAVLGLAASCVSDCSSNSLRVIKTTKQTATLGKKQDQIDVEDSINIATTTATTTSPLLEAMMKNETKPTLTEPTYVEVVQMIIEKDGIAGLFGRGLQTRLLTNAIQGAVFSVCWKYFQSTM